MAPFFAPAKARVERKQVLANIFNDQEELKADVAMWLTRQFGRQSPCLKVPGVLTAGEVENQASEKTRVCRAIPATSPDRERTRPEWSGLANEKAGITNHYELHRR